MLDDYFVERVKELRCRPCEDDCGDEKSAGVVWHTRRMTRATKSRFCRFVCDARR
jgi:hypothetical protein